MLVHFLMWTSSWNIATLNEKPRPARAPSMTPPVVVVPTCDRYRPDTLHGRHYTPSRLFQPWTDRRELPSPNIPLPTDGSQTNAAAGLDLSWVPSYHCAAERGQKIKSGHQLSVSSKSITPPSRPQPSRRSGQTTQFLTPHLDTNTHPLNVVGSWP